MVAAPPFTAPLAAKSFRVFFFSFSFRPVPCFGFFVLMVPPWGGVTMFRILQIVRYASETTVHPGASVLLQTVSIRSKNRRGPKPPLLLHARGRGAATPGPRRPSDPLRQLRVVGEHPRRGPASSPVGGLTTV